MISIKNVILPNKPLNNFKLEDAVQKLKIPSFRGVFSLDTLPKKPNKKECGIVNFDKNGGPGTHWARILNKTVQFDISKRRKIKVGQCSQSCLLTYAP